MNGWSGRNRSRGFTMAETMVVVGLVFVLVSIVLPATQRQKGQATLNTCVHNLKTLMAAHEMYGVDNQNAMLALTWPPVGAQSVTVDLKSTNPEPRALLKYIQQPTPSSVFRCPSTGTETYTLTETFSASSLGATIRCTNAGRRSHPTCAANYPALETSAGQGVLYAP